MNLLALEWVTAVRPLVEFLYFLSGPLLVIVAAIALRQLTITKKDSVVRVKRESATLSVSLCSEFNAMLPKTNDLLAKLSDHGLPTYPEEGPAELFAWHEVLGWSPDWAEKWVRSAETVSSQHPETTAQVLRTVNSLEGIALYFVKAIADERLAFGPIAPAYCELVHDLYPFIVYRRDSADSDTYRSICDLHSMWSSRLTRQQVERDMRDLRQKLENLPERGIKPLGLE